MSIEIVIDGRIVAIKAPYYPRFVSDIRALGGRWDGGSNTWIVHPSVIKEAEGLLTKHFGWTSTGETATITISTDQDLYGDREAVYAGGIQIAKAFGRDSGAKVGDNVALLEGRISSGGSRKNWVTRVAAGSRFRLIDVPVGLADILREEGWAVEAVDTCEVNTETLKTERADLVARIAEIDRILAATERHEGAA